jgi:hypothetical protein
MMDVHPMRDEDRPQLAALLRSDEFALYTAAYQVEQHHYSFPWWVAVRNGAVVGFLEGHFNSLYDERMDTATCPVLGSTGSASILIIGASGWHANSSALSPRQHSRRGTRTWPA